MDVSDLRKRILRALDEARKDTAFRRRAADESSLAYERFLQTIAAPLLRQAATVLRAEGHDFAAHAPAGSVRLASDRSPQDFLEFELDTSGPKPVVLGRVSVARARKGLVVEERPLAPGKTIAELTDDDVATFLVTELPRLVGRP